MHPYIAVLNLPVMQRPVRSWPLSSCSQDLKLSAAPPTAAHPMETAATRWFIEMLCTRLLSVRLETLRTFALIPQHPTVYSTFEWFEMCLVPRLYSGLPTCPLARTWYSLWRQRVASIVKLTLESSWMSPVQALCKTSLHQRPTRLCS
jgi:hypothetical protein